MPNLALANFNTFSTLKKLINAYPTFRRALKSIRRYKKSKPRGQISLMKLNSISSVILLGIFYKKGSVDDCLNVCQGVLTLIIQVVRGSLPHSILSKSITLLGGTPGKGNALGRWEVVIICWCFCNSICWMDCWYRSWGLACGAEKGAGSAMLGLGGCW